MERVQGKEGEMAGRIRFTIEERLLYKRVIAESGCWEYQGYLTGKAKTHCGFYSNGKQSYAHIVAYETWIGPVGDNCVLHKCDNGVCINPDHLFLGSPADNTADMVSKGRQAKRESHSQAKLTWEDVKIIRVLPVLGFNQTEIATLFRVDPSHISLIVNRKRVWL